MVYVMFLLWCFPNRIRLASQFSGIGSDLNLGMWPREVKWVEFGQVKVEVKQIRPNWKDFGEVSE